MAHDCKTRAEANVLALIDKTLANINLDPPPALEDMTLAEILIADQIPANPYHLAFFARTGSMMDGARAKAWRKSRGLSQQKLGGLTGYCAATISDFENGVTRDMKTAIKPAMWRRYRLACAAVDHDLHLTFDWQTAPPQS